jgi:hypothetical protein
VTLSRPQQPDVARKRADSKKRLGRKRKFDSAPLQPVYLRKHITESRFRASARPDALSPALTKRAMLLCAILCTFRVVPGRGN